MAIHTYFSDFINKITKRALHPQAYSFIRDKEIAKALFEEGYFIMKLLSHEQVKQAKEIYTRFGTEPVYEMHYNTNEKHSGAYVGLLSTQIHQTLAEVLVPTISKWFFNYTNYINAFSVKTPGPDGKVPIHQDMAVVDERKYSSLSIWIALEYVNAENGALGVIPKSHKLFSPYRAATIPNIVEPHESLLTPHFVTVCLKPGEAILFDPRIFHCSLPNLSSKNRVAINLSTLSARS